MRARFTLCCLLILTTAATVRAEADFIDAETLRAADLVKFYELRLPLGAGQEIVASHLVDDQHYLFTNGRLCVRHPGLHRTRSAGRGR